MIPAGRRRLGSPTASPVFTSTPFTRAHWLGAAKRPTWSADPCHLPPSTASTSDGREHLKDAALTQALRSRLLSTRDGVIRAKRRDTARAGRGPASCQQRLPPAS